MSYENDKKLFRLAVTFSYIAEQKIDEDIETVDDAHLEKVSEEIGESIFDVFFVPDNLYFQLERLDDAEIIEIPDLAVKIFSGVDEFRQVNVKQYIQSQVCLRGAEAVAKLMLIYYKGKELPDLVSEKDRTEENEIAFLERCCPNIASFFAPSL